MTASQETCLSVATFPFEREGWSRLRAALNVSLRRDFYRKTTPVLDLRRPEFFIWQALPGYAGEQLKEGRAN